MEPSVSILTPPPPGSVSLSQGRHKSIAFSGYKKDKNAWDDTSRC